MRDRMPRLSDHLDSFEFGLDLLLTKWLICLFVNHLPLDAELAVWDLFMIKGISVLFRVAITLFQIMENEILACHDYGEIFMTVDKYGLKVTREQLLKNLYSGIRNKEIEEYRAQFRIEVFDMLTEQLEQAVVMPTHNPNKRLEFLAKFQLYQGLVSYYQTYRD